MSRKPESNSRSWYTETDENVLREEKFEPTVSGENFDFQQLESDRSIKFKNSDDFHDDENHPIDYYSNTGKMFEISPLEQHKKNIYVAILLIFFSTLSLLILTIYYPVDRLNARNIQDPNKQAYVTLIRTTEDMVPAHVLSTALKKTNTSRTLIALVCSELPSEDKHTVSSWFTITIEVDPLFVFYQPEIPKKENQKSKDPKEETSKSFSEDKIIKEIYKRDSISDEDLDETKSNSKKEKNNKQIKEKNTKQVNTDPKTQVEEEEKEKEKDEPQQAHEYRVKLDHDYMKLAVWSLDSYQWEKVVFIDVEVLPIQNIDSLFEFNELSVIPECCDLFSTYLFVLVPGEFKYQQMLMALQETYEPLYFSSSQHSSTTVIVSPFFTTFLNEFWSLRQRTTISFTYAAQQTLFTTHRREWEERSNDIKAIHYNSEPKPWRRNLDLSASQKLGPIHKYWEQIYDEIKLSKNNHNDSDNDKNNGDSNGDKNNHSDSDSNNSDSDKFEVPEIV